MEWGEHFRVGVEKFDLSHEAIAAIIGRMEESARKKGTQAEWASLLDQLIALCAAHFAEEEEELARRGYPELLEHQDEHRNLMNELSELAARQKERGAGPNAETAEFLDNWLSVHVAETDMRYRSLFTD